MSRFHRASMSLIKKGGCAARTRFKTAAAQLLQMTRGRTNQDALLLSQAGLFDPQYYASQLASCAEPSIEHFLTAGWRRGLAPSPFFDGAFYLALYSDVKNAGRNPVMHYIRYGWREGRLPHPKFDVQKYKAAHLNIDFALEDPLQHCIRNYCSLDWHAHVSQFGGKGSNKQPLSTYDKNKIAELFDQAYYISTYKDTLAPGIDPLVDYTVRGWRENMNPSPEFDTWYFLRNYPQFAHQDDCPLHEFVRAGMPTDWNLRSPNAVTLDPRSNTSVLGNRRNLRLAIHVHAFYPEFVTEVYRVLEKVAYPFELFMTTCSIENEKFIADYLKSSKRAFSLDILTVENRGRDICPMLTAFPRMWACYDVIAHVHSKKSRHTEFGDEWRRYLLAQMLGSAELVESIMFFMTDNKDVGFFFPDNYYKIKKYIEWGDSWDLVLAMLRRLDVPTPPKPTIPEFAAGSMAWFRTSAFRRFVSTFNSTADFEIERGQLDGTVAHAIERAFPLIAEAEGFRSTCYYLRNPPMGSMP
jgi:O-antigen biosynthesis protein